MPKKRRPWPEKRRKDQAKRARVNTPWAHSTGPTTPAGKAVCAANALKSGFHTEEMRALKALLRTQAAALKAIEGRHEH